MFGVGAVDDDDLDFNPSAGSKLASLFNLEKSHEKGNASLTYTAPKQPKHHHSNDDGSPPSGRSGSAGLSSTSASNKLTLVVVKAVSSYKLEDGNYNHQGKLGLALLGNSASRIFQLLLYKGKQQQIASARISSHFQFTVQPHLYASFYDDRRQNWSILFESKDDAVDFVTQVAVARYRAADPSEEAIISQEILPGSGNCCKEGDTVHLQLSAQPFSVSSVQALDIHQSLMKCALTHKLTNLGWAAGLLGAAPGSLRLVLVPLKTTLPWLTSKRSDPLLVEVKISCDESDDTSNCKLSPSTHSIRDEAPASSVDSAVDSSNEDSSVRARGASIREALTNSPRSNKASIISRMARMGQATLPLKGAVTCNPSDSEETEEDSGATEGTKPPPKARPGKSRLGSSSIRHQHEHSPASSSSQTIPTAGGVGTSAVTVLQSSSPWSQHQQNVLGQVVSLHSQHQLPLVAAQSTMMSPTDQTPHISMFLSEARIHNTEMRMHLSKFGDKMDQLMTKVDNLHSPSVTPGPTSMGGMGLEPTVLLSSIEKLVRDNQSLQTEVVDKNKRLEEQNERIFSLLNTNSRFLEQSSSLLEQQQKQEQQQQQQEQQLQLIQQMKEEKTSIENRLGSLQNQLATVQELVQALQKSNTELNQELNSTRCQLQEKEKFLRELELNKKNFGADDRLPQLTQALDEQKALNAKLQEQITNERAKFNSKNNIAIERYTNLEQKHLAEISLVKDQLSKEEADRFKKSITSLETECVKLRAKLENQLKQPVSSTDSMIADVKILMNTLYRGLNQQFTLGQSYEGDFIRAVIASTVKKEALEFVGRLEKQKIPISKDLTDSKGKFESPNSVCVNKVQQKNEPNKEAELSQEQNVAHVQSTLSESTPLKEDIAQTLLEHDLSNQKAVLESSELSTEDKRDRDASLERSWRPLPPPPPLFHDEDDSDDWLT